MWIIVKQESNGVWRPLIARATGAGVRAASKPGDWLIYWSEWNAAFYRLEFVEHTIP